MVARRRGYLGCLPLAYTNFNAHELMEGISLAAMLISMCFTYMSAISKTCCKGME